jgi:hypothetical protein
LRQGLTNFAKASLELEIFLLYLLSSWDCRHESSKFGSYKLLGEAEGKYKEE